MTDTPPQVPYWHLYVDGDGITCQRRCMMTKFKMKSIASGTSAQWLGSEHEARATVVTTVLPVGWSGDWHPNPKPQWIIPLSGRWSVESMDGQLIEMGVGEISFGEDQGTGERDGKKGHRSATLGDQPCTLMLVQFETSRDDTSTCPFP